MAGPGRALARLLGRGEPRVRFAVPEDRAAAVAVGTLLEVKIAPSGTTVRGRVTGVAPEVDVSSRMVFATANLDPRADSGAPLNTGLLARVFCAPAAAAHDPER
jgi:hypothetical protein